MFLERGLEPDDALPAPRVRPAVLAWGALAFAIGATPFVNAIVAPTDFDAARSIEYLADPKVLWLLKLRGMALIAVMLGAAGGLLAIGRSRPGAAAICATGFLYSMAAVVSGVLGLEPHMRGTLLIQPVMFASVLFLPRISQTRFGRWVMTTVVVFAWASLAAAVFMPSLVLQPYSLSWIPGFGFRLHGVGLHATHLGPIMVFYWAVRWLVLGKRRGLGVNDVAVLLVLLLAQSKTAWILFLVIALLALVQNRRVDLPWARWPVIALAIFAAVLFTDMGDPTGLFAKLVGVLPSKAQSEMTTLTGRTLVWRETLYLWELNPWFGYGPGLWDIEMQDRYREVIGWAAPGAHSQFYEVLGESGLVGIGTLALYLGTIVFTALRYGGRDPIVTAIAVIIIVRGITEAPLGTSADDTLLVHFWSVAFLVLVHRAHVRARALAAEQWVAPRVERLAAP